MSDLFDQFVFDLQRFDWIKYSDIGTEGKPSWLEEEQKIFLYDNNEDFSTTDADEAYLEVTVEDDKITAVSKVRPVAGTGKSLYFAAAEGDTDNGTLLTYTSKGTDENVMYFDVGEPEDAEEEGGAVIPIAIHFMVEGDSIVLNDGGLTSFGNGTAIYIEDTPLDDGNEDSALNNFSLENITPGEDKALTYNGEGFDLTGLVDGDRLIVRTDVDVFFTDGDDETTTAGSNSVTFTTEGDLDITVASGLTAQVVSDAINVESKGGIYEKDVTVNGTTINLQTTGFVYDKMGDTPVLFLTDVDFNGADEEEEPEGDEGDETDIEEVTRKITIGGQTFYVAALSEVGSGFVIDEDAVEATGFIFSGLDNNVGIIVTSDVDPSSFKFYKGDPEGPAYIPQAVEVVEDTDEIAIPTVTVPDGENYVVWKSIDDDEDSYSLIVPEGAVITDENGTTITVTSLGESEGSDNDRYVEIVFDEENGTILGVMPTQRTITEDEDGKLDVITDEDFDERFSNGTQIDVVSDENFVPGTSQGIYFGDPESVVEVGTGDYTFGVELVEQGSDSTINYIKLTNAEETVYSLDVDDAVKLIPAEGTTATITDNTDSPDEEADENDPTYTVTNISTSAFFVVDNESDSGEHQLTGFVFGGVSDAIGRPAYSEEDTFQLGYLDDEGTPTLLETTPQVDVEHTITQVTDDPTFSADGFSKAGANVTMNDGETFTFGASEAGNAFFFNSSGSATGFNATAKVSMDSGAAAFLAGGSFAINGASVDITAIGESLVYDASESSLFGLSSGSEIVNAGNITKVYGASGSNNELIVGRTTYTYSAQGSSAADLAYFTVDGTSATGFTFVLEGDVLNVSASMVKGGFSIADEDNGAIDTPAVYNSNDALKEKYTLTKEGSPDYAISGFSAGDYAEVGKGTVTFETLAGESASIIFDATTAIIGGISYLTKGDAVRAEGISTAVNFDGAVVEIAGASVSYLYTKTGSASSTLTDVFADVTIKQLGGASYVGSASGTNGIGVYAFDINGASSKQSFIIDSTGKDDDVNGVNFMIGSGSIVNAITGINDGEVVVGTGSAFEALETVNTQEFDVKGASYIGVIGTADASKLSEIAVIGSSVAVNAVAGASFVTTYQVDQISFAGASAFTLAGGQSNDIIFAIDENLVVNSISDVEAVESVKGYFDGVEAVNGVSFAVDDKDAIMIVGSESTKGITKIADVSSGASIANVGGASEVVTDTEGTFFFAGSSTFTVAGDSSVTFEMVKGAAASVAGINGFGQGDESFAVVAGNLNGLYINAEDKIIDVEGDADDVLAYAKQTYEGEDYYGLAVAGSSVTINGAASATFIEAGSDGKYTFAMDQDDDSTTYTVGGDSEIVFEVDGNKVVGIYDMEKGASVTGNFSNVVAVEGISSTGELLEEGTVQIMGDSSVTVVYDDFEVKELSNGASITSATTFKHAYTDAATDALTVTDADGDQFTVENDADGVHYLLDGKGNIVGVSGLDEGATLSGALGALSSVNGKAFDVKEEILNYGGLSAGDGKFAIVGGSNAKSIGAIVELGGRVTVTDGGGASKFATNDNVFITSGGDQYVVAALKELSPEQLEGIIPSTVPAELIAQIAPYVIESDGVEFVTDGKDVVTAVNGLSGNELIATFGQSLVGGDFPINGKPVNVEGDVKLIAAQGSNDYDGISALIVGGSSNVVVNKAAGAYGVLALGVSSITFGSASAFTITSDKDIPGVGFGFSSGVAVDSVVLLNNNESVTGYFDDVVQVNGADFDVKDADEIMVVGNASVDAVSKIANVSDSAVIAKVGGASQVITDESGTFTFTNSNQVFEVHELDDSVTFDMNGNDVANINIDFGVAISDNSNFANVSVNGALVDIKGDEGDMAIGALSSGGIDLVANLGSANGVTVNNAGGASLIGTDKNGDFTFTNDGRKFNVAGDSQVVFVLDADENVTAVMGADKGASITGDFSKAVAFAGYSNASATEFTTATVQIAGDSYVMVEHDDFVVRMLSNGASISSATTVYKAYTDAAKDAPLTVIDASGDEFTVYGDADGVMYSLDGAGEIIGISGLDKGATLGGSLSALKVINGVSFAVAEYNEPESLKAGDGKFSVVGSSDGISEIIGLSGAVFVGKTGGASVLRADGNIALSNFAADSVQGFIAVGVEPKSTVFSASDGVNFYLDENDNITAIDDIDGNEVVESNRFNDVTKLNGKAFDVKGDSGFMAVLGKDDNDGIAAVIGVGNSVDGATVAAAAGASFVLADSEGALTFANGASAATFTLATDADSIGVGFSINDKVAVESIDYLDKADKVFGNFSDGITVNGELIKATDDKDSVIGVAGAQSWAGVSELFVQADATVTAWGSATSVNASLAGEFVFVGADNSAQNFFATDTTDNNFTFITDKNRVTGVQNLDDGGIALDPAETTALDVNTADYPAQSLTFASSESVAGFNIADRYVIAAGGINGSISGIIAPSATVYGVEGDTDINVNGKDIFVDDVDDQFNVVVHDGTPDYVYDVDGDATVNAQAVSVRANSEGSDTNPTKDTYVIAGESYVFDDTKDENDGFTFVTDEDGTMNKVASLEGALVINDGEWAGNINGDDFEVIDYPNDDNPPVTVNAGVSGIESVGGLDHKDTVNGDLADAQVHIPGYGEEGGHYPGTTITINGKPYTVVTDPDGVDVTGDDADVITDLDNQASLVGAEGDVTVNGTELEPEEGDIIKGDSTTNTHARIVGDDELIRQATAINHYNHRGYDVDTEETTAAAFNIEDVVGLPTYTGAPTAYLDRDDTDAINAGSSAIDFNQPMIVSLWNVDSLTGEAYKTEQVFDMSSYSYTKKVYMNGEGPQAVKFNNEGGNLAVVADGATGVKNVSLGAGGDAVVMDEDYALQNAVYIFGGAGDDSVFVRHNAETYIDFSAGGEDIIVTAGEANARVSVTGYNATTGAAIRVEEYLDVENETAGTIAEGIENGIISFAEGTVIITSDEGKSEVSVGTNGYGGQIVNLMTHATSGDDYKQAVGFTGSDGGIVDGSTYTSPLIMIGNSDNTKTAGSSLVGGTANDTFYAGADDTVEVGYGNDYVSLYNDSLRGGAYVDIGAGRTTIEGANNTLADSTGDVISVAIDPTDRTFSLVYNADTQTVELESSADGYYALLTDVDTLEGNYTTQYIYDTVGEELYSVAIGTVNSTIQVTEDEDLRPNVFFGNQTAIDFRNYTGDAIIDLKGDMAESIIDETIVIIDDDITTLYAGAGDTALKGDLDDETLYAGKGNTWLYGDGGKNLLVGYEGADKEGQTVFYVLGNEDGAAHTISGFNYVTDDNYTDTKKVTADALEFDLDDNNITRIDISGNDLVIEITDKLGSDTESALLKDAINADGTGKDFIVSDNVAQVAEDTLVFDQFADYYYATGKNATVQVSGRIEDDVILWLDEDETGKVFEGDIHVIDATNSDATAQLAGNENDNVIYAGTGETSLWGGEGGNDVLVGNAGGRDTFYYSFGNGDDTITNVKDGDIVALDVSLDQIDEIDMSDATAIRIIMNDGDVLTINDNGASVGIMIDNGEGGTDTYYTDEARARQ